MNFAFTEEQEELRAAARSFLAVHSSSAQVRRAMESDLGHDPEVWKRIATELGWPAVTVPESFGGLGLGQVELSALLETTGESLLCAPFFSTVCLAANAILSAGNPAQQAELLPGIAAGRCLAALAAPRDAADIEVLARPDGADFVLEGHARFVLDGHCADVVVVAARAEGSQDEEGISLFHVAGDTEGLTRSALPTMDRTRRLADLSLSAVRAPRAALLGDEGGAWPALERALDLACVGMAAEQVGSAQRCLDLSVEHAKERIQFGRPIGSFQAIQHKCADVMIAVESARSAAYYAACVADEQPDELASTASLAKASASEAAWTAAAEAIQIHGGVGFTWEYDVHLYFKRARASESLLGDPAWHRERIARRLGL